MTTTNNAKTTKPVKTMKSFNISEISEPVNFLVDGDEFEAVPSNRLPAGVLAKYFEMIDNSKLFEAHEYFFTSVLAEESAKRFKDRLDSVDKPITVSVMGDIASWLLGEVYLQGEVTDDAKSS